MFSAEDDDTAFQAEVFRCLDPPHMACGTAPSRPGELVLCHNVTRTTAFYEVGRSRPLPVFHIV